MRLSSSRILLIGLCVVANAGLAWSAGMPAQKCEAAKKKAAGSYASCRLKAEAKFVTTADATKRAASLSKCAAKLNVRYAKLDDGDTCAYEGEATNIDEMMTAFVDAAKACVVGGSCVPLDDCGNGSVDVGEQCDQSDTNGDTCVTQGFVGGTLGCGAGCVFDTGECWAARFVDNADGTIVDNRFGSTWEKKVRLNGAVDYANLHDADNVYRWAGTCSIGGDMCQPDAASEAACLAGVEGDPVGCTQCVSGVCAVGAPGITVWQWLVSLNAASFAGHDDWRLPRKGDLTQIVDPTTHSPAVDAAFHGGACGGACSDLTLAGCSCTRSNPYWSATSYVVAPLYACPINFTGGGEQVFDKPVYAQSVRAVR